MKLLCTGTARAAWGGRRRRLGALVASALVVAGCGTFNVQSERTATMRGAVRGDVTVIGLHITGERLGDTAAVVARVESQLRGLFNGRARSTAELRAAIRMQLAPLSLLDSDRRDITARVDAVADDHYAAFRLLRAHEVAAIIDETLRARARDHAFASARADWARGAHRRAAMTIDDVAGWLVDTIAPPTADELPAALRARYADALADADGSGRVAHLRPLRTLLPHGAAHGILTTAARDTIPADVVEQAARIGSLLTLDKVVLAGSKDGQPWAVLVDVATRSMAGEWLLPAALARR